MADDRDSDHMESDDVGETTEDTSVPAPSAEEWKTKGNVLYKEGNYREAVDMYSKAIELDPANASYYGNRAAAYMTLKKYAQALEDANSSTRVDPNFIKGHMRAAACLLQLGQTNPALRAYEIVLQVEPNNATVQQEIKNARIIAAEIERGKADLTAKSYQQALNAFMSALRYAPDAPVLKLLKVEAMLGLKWYEDAAKLASEVLQDDRNNVTGLYLRGLALYYVDNTTQALNHFRNALQCEPDHAPSLKMLKQMRKLEALKAEGNEHFKAGRYQEAVDVYTTALAVDENNTSMNSKLYGNRAAALGKMGRDAEAISDCDRAIELDDKYLKAYMRRAGLYKKVEKFQEAVVDLEKCKTLDPRNDEVKGLLREAKLDLKKSLRKDYYKILDIPKDANEATIKNGYKRGAMKWHPDKNSETEESRKHAENMFKDVGEAYAVLSDPQKRAAYDQGHDLEEIESGHGGGFHGHDIDPNQIFEMFMGGGGFGGFGGGGGRGFGGGGGGRGFGGGGFHFG